MGSLNFAAGALQEMRVDFPNLFGGTEISLQRGFRLFGIDIYWYGVIMAVGVVLAFAYVMRRVTKDFGVSQDRAFDVIFVCIIGGFFCARVYYCVFVTLDPNNPTTYNPITMITQMRDGGIAIYGGIIGAFLIGILMCRFRKANFFAMADAVSPGFLIGQTIGRWGNFINQEAYGAECSKDWLFAMGGNRIDIEMGAGKFVHPCFLYESVWCLLGFVFLHIYSKKLRTFDGEIALLYAAWYGFGRAFIEQLRTDSLYWGPLKVSQWVGAISFVLAIACFVFFKIKTKKTGRLLYVNTDASKELIENDRKAELEKKSAKEKKAESILKEEIDVSENNQTEETAANEQNEQREEITTDEEKKNVSEDN